MVDDREDEFFEGLLYRPVKDRSMSRNRCFLCGVEVRGSTRTAEHVFPRWLLRKYHLARLHITLLNGESIEYGRLKIACCPECNNIWLSKVEEQVKAAIESGYAAVAALDRSVLFAWLAKIFYGILFKELSVLLDSKDPAAGSILPSEVFEEFDMLHQLLQCIRFTTEFLGNQPWSIFVLECHVQEDINDNFDFLDSLGGLCLGIRIGSVGILACLEDNNSLEQADSEFYNHFAGHPLHWIQFRELFARMVYSQGLLNRTPKFIVKLPDTASPNIQVISLPMQGFTAAPIYDEWNHADYAKYLAHFTQLPLEIVFREPDLVMTWLRNESGEVKKMNADEHI